MFFKGKKENKVIELMSEHLDKIEEVIIEFNDLINCYCNGITCDALKEKSYKVHLKEHEADEIRRKIQTELLAGAFLPFYRENFIKIPDMIDQIASDAVQISKDLFLEFIQLPDELKNYLRQISAAILDTLRKFIEMFDFIPDEIDKVIEYSHEVSKCEQKVDKLEWAAKVYIFKENKTLDKVDKIICNSLVTKIADIANVIEDAADYINLTMIKMKI
ncbi:MAG TPA: DUF47 family protein [bacterium]|nr:DUF47 family protein [bacterium]HOL47787.1 DUF47 family protein [bacterium]HPQ18622.1 DUF47 family protein [bacterium]